MLQKEGFASVCELCKKHGKDAGLKVENGRSEEMSAQTGLKTVPSDAKLSPHITQRQGKVCVCITWVLIDNLALACA